MRRTAARGPVDGLGTDHPIMTTTQTGEGSDVSHHAVTDEDR